jgi:hypothetical protein
MGFFTPWFLAGVAALGLPVWLHLLKKHKTTPLPFSSLMFFERRTQSSIKHRRLQYLLLLALRLALLAFIVLAFAQPFIRSRSAGITRGRKLIVLAIDQSFSMRQGNRLERAKGDAQRTASALRGDDRAQVLAFGSHVRVMAEPTGDAAQLRAAVEAVPPTDERGSYVELARALRSIAQSAKVPVEAHLFSDLQKSSMPANFADLRLGEGIRLVPHAAAGGTTGNFTIEAVNVPRRVYDTKNVRVQATIAGFGTGPAARRVSLILNGRELESKQVNVTATGRASVEFDSLQPSVGLNRGEVRLAGEDAFPNDDRFYFAIDRAEPRRILFVHEAKNTRGLLYFRTALESASGAGFQIDPATPDQAAHLSPEQYAFVVLSDVSQIPSAFDTALRSYVRSGGSVLVALGRSSASIPRVPVFDEAILQARYAARDADRFQTVANFDPAYPAIRNASRLEDVRFYQAVQVRPGDARIAARLSDQTPLILDKQVGEGRVVVFASTFDNISNDFPLHASFVPFVEKTAQYLGRLDEGQANLLVDSYLELRGAGQQASTVEVLDPQNSRALSLEESTRARNLLLAKSGYYEVRRPSGRHELVAVNVDRHESDLEVIPQETLALWQNTGQAGAAGEQADENGERRVPIWPYVLAIALALAVAESLVGNRHLALEKESS